MSIVGGLFRAAGLGSLVDGLEAQGIMKAGERVAPTLFPEMFIGKEGVSNLGKAGIPGSEDIIKNLESAQKDWFKLPAEDWMTKYADSGIAFDPVANKAMLEISDANVTVKPGINLNKLPSDEQLGFNEVFKADTLSKAYPDIGNVKIGFLDDPRSPRLAGFDAATNTVYFNRQNPEWKPENAKSIMLHEVQHFVQGKELFTKGEGFQNVLQQNAVYQNATSSLDKSIAQASSEVPQFLKQNKGLGFTEDNVTTALGALAARDGMPVLKALEKAFKSKSLAEKFVVKTKNYGEMNAALMAKEASSEAYKQSINDYMKVAGEVFARQTEERANMSLNERLANPAMRGIETNPTNKAFGITVDNMTAPVANLQQSSIPAPAVPQSSIPGLY